MNKTETIKKRRVDVYLKSEEQKDRWNEFAETRKTSLSKLVIQAMEVMINGDLLGNIEIKEKLIEENEQLRTENEKMKNRTKNIEKYIEILENQINRSQNLTLSDPGPGFRFHNENLIRVLKESKIPVSNQDILGRINVNPADTEVVKSVSNQIDALASYGVIKYQYFTNFLNRNQVRWPFGTFI